MTETKETPVGSVEACEVCGGELQGWDDRWVGYFFGTRKVGHGDCLSELDRK